MLIITNPDAQILIGNVQLFHDGITMYCDSAEPDRIKMWRDAGYWAKPVEKGAKV